MRHRKDHRKLSRTHSHRRALLRNLVTSLIEHERIETTLAKAKEARRVGERMVTFAKRGDIPARRQVARYVHGDHNVKKLFETVAPWYAERNGGYTRILKLGRRLGDAGEMALLEFVKTPEIKEQLRKVADEKAKAERAATKALAPGKGKAAKGAAEGKAAKGAAETEATPGEGKKGHAPREKAAKPERPGPRKGGPKPSKAPTRARQRGKSGE